MKAHDSDELAARKSRIEDRLDRDSWPEKGGAVLAGGNEQRTMSRRERATAVGGIGLVHRLVRQIGLPKLIDESLKVFLVHCPYHYHFYITNAPKSELTARQVIRESNERCNQENLIEQLWPNREQGEELRRMEFRRFVASLIAIPCQIVRTGRHIVHRFLAYSSWLESIFRAHAHFKRMVFT